MLVAVERTRPVRSNIPLRRRPGRCPTTYASDGHSMVDFGDDGLTRGRPHPMIDGTLRLERLLAEGGRPGACGVLLLDVVLGHGADPTPRPSSRPALARRADRARGGRDLASWCRWSAPRDDPQGLRRQVAALHGAGAWVHLSNADGRPRRRSTC